MIHSKTHFNSLSLGNSKHGNLREVNGTRNTSDFVVNCCDMFNSELGTRHITEHEEVEARLNTSYEFHCDASSEFRFYASFERTYGCIIDVGSIDIPSHLNL